MKKNHNTIASNNDGGLPYCNSKTMIRKAGVAGKVLIVFFRGYRYLISPLFPPSCRFTPTCSQYAIEAVTRYGVCRGVSLAVWRILRCHPFAKGGYDPVK